MSWNIDPYSPVHRVGNTEFNISVQYPLAITYAVMLLARPVGATAWTNLETVDYPFEDPIKDGPAYLDLIRDKLNARLKNV